MSTQPNSSKITLRSSFDEYISRNSGNFDDNEDGWSDLWDGGIMGRLHFPKDTSNIDKVSVKNGSAQGDLVGKRALSGIQQLKKLMESWNNGEVLEIGKDTFHNQNQDILEKPSAKETPCHCCAAGSQLNIKRSQSYTKQYKRNYRKQYNRSQNYRTYQSDLPPLIEEPLEEGEDNADMDSSTAGGNLSNGTVERNIRKKKKKCLRTKFGTKKIDISNFVNKSMSKELVKGDEKDPSRNIELNVNSYINDNLFAQEKIPDDFNKLDAFYDEDYCIFPNDLSFEEIDYDSEEDFELSKEVMSLLVDCKPGKENLD